MSKTVACLFPACGMKYREFNRDILAGCREESARYRDLAASVVEIHQRKFEQPDEVVLDVDRRASTTEDDFAPQPGRPGTPSAVSPTSAR